MVMVGAGSRFLPLPEEAYVEALGKCLAERLVDVNVKAFRAGRALVQAEAGSSEKGGMRR